MTDRIHPPQWPSPRGPWPEVEDVDRLYDHGRPWCTNAAAHPEENAGYPDPERHLPWHECHGPVVFLDGGRAELDGAEVDLSVYAAAAFRYGQGRDDSAQPRPRVVIQTWLGGGDEAGRG